MTHMSRILSLTVRLPMSDPRSDTRILRTDITKAISHIVQDYFERDLVVSTDHIDETKTTTDDRREDKDVVHIFRLHYVNVIINDTVFTNDFLRTVKYAISDISHPAYTGEVFVDIDDPSPVRNGEEWLLSPDAIKLATIKLPTFNNTQTLRDPFGFYLSYFDEKAFKEHIDYIAAAFYKIRMQDKHATTVSSAAAWQELVAKKAPTMSEEEAENAYHKASNFAYTVITLHVFAARMGSKEEAETSKYLRELIAFYMRKAFYGNVDAMAEAFSIYVRDEVFYMEGKLYRFMDGRCVEADALELFKHREKAFCSMVESNYNAFVRRKIMEGCSHDEGVFSKNKADCMKRFSLTPAEAYIGKLARKYLYTRRYTGVDQYATAFKDGLLVLRTEGAVVRSLSVRPTLMEDQIFETGNAFIYPRVKYSWEHPLVKSIDNCFRQVFVHEEQVQWFYRWLASTLAKTPERILLVLYGEKGGNAKSEIFMAIKRMYGRYCYAAHDSVLHMDPSSGHQAALAEVDGCNLMYTSEPNTMKPVACNVAKDLCGGDPKKLSKKNKDHKEVEQRAKFAMLCNQMVQFKDIDEALLDRLRILSCVARYLPVQEDDPKNHIYIRDNNFWHRPGIENVLLWMMIQKWPDYVKYGLKPNKFQEEDLDKWRQDICPLSKWFANGCCKDNPTSATLSMFDLDQVWETYEAWADRHTKETPKLQREDFIQRLRKRCKPVVMDVEFRDTNCPNVAGIRTKKEIAMLWMKNTINEPVKTRCFPIIEHSLHQTNDVSRQSVVASVDHPALLAAGGPPSSLPSPKDAD